MSEFFKAIKNFKPPTFSNDYYIKVENKEIVSVSRDPLNHSIKISKQDYKLLLDHGKEFYYYDGGLVVKPRKKTERVFKILKKDTNGYKLIEHDPHWPDGTVEGGHTWQTPVE